MRNLKFPVLLFLIPFIASIMLLGCSDSSSSNSVDEYAVLVEYLEGAGGDYINTLAPAIKTASAVRTDMTSGTQYLIDIRSAADFATGHVDGAVNVAFSDLLSHVEGISSSPESIIIICYSGQTAAYGTSLLRLMGHDNVYSMKFGMSSWHSDFDVWTAKLANTYAIEFETTENLKGGEVDSPELETDFDEPMDILRARVEEVFAGGFSGAATVGASTVVTDAANYYIVNYWPQAEYLDPGHIEGAYCYLPKTDLHSSTFLNTLPADETVVIYCYTGQTSANVTAFLKVLGYDAKSLVYGANNMIYDTMVGHKFSAAAIMDYDYITGP